MMLTISNLISIDSFSLILGVMILFLAGNIGLFSWRYLKGDQGRKKFILKFIPLIFSLLVLISADHLFLFFMCWCLSNGLLIRLMLHQPEWKACVASSQLAKRSLFTGAAFIGGAFLLFAFKAKETSISQLVLTFPKNGIMALGLLLLTFGAMIQSALWPFQRWLLSSMNAPTPVSAIMHAGLVNGGGIVLIRFSGIFDGYSGVLTMVFVLGMISSLVGTFWKLLQTDVKRMLACSTVGQMGFMFMQIGLGMIPAAIAHLVWHGFFKSYLFLSSGSAAQEKKAERVVPTLSSLLLALCIGAVGSFAFACLVGYRFFALDRSFVLTVIAWMSTAQIALVALGKSPIRNVFPALATSLFFAGGYALSIYGIEKVIPFSLSSQPLCFLHLLGIFVLGGSWLLALFPHWREKSPLWRSLYVKGLNGSQPHPETITTHRNHYTV
jgi:NAD(P)H-quinone oxidoreductase subunit 5